MSTTIDPATVRGAVLVLPLEAAEATLERVGGKGTALARLARAGLPVPPGFHVTTEAYRRFVAANGLHTAIVTAASDAPVGEPDFLERAAARIQALFAGGALPDDVARAIRQAYTGLGDGVAVAVRSSATAEDLPELSFAGQHESYLNVRGEAAVLDAITRCWASLWTARALGYRARAGIPPEDVSLAVVVQELVPADVAGVLFTADPVTGARDRVLINAAWGLGEAIVGGLVTPDSLTLDKGSGSILAREIADKAVMTVRAADGTRTEAVPAECRGAPVLRPEQVAELTRLAREIEQLWGEPVDIEWAMHDGQIFIVQARPITALPEPPVAAPIPPPADWPLPNPQAKYFRASVVELLPDPLSPLFETLALPEWNAAMVELARHLGMGDFARQYALTTINGYAYYCMPFTPLQMAGFAARLPLLIPRAARLLNSARQRWEDDARPAYAGLTRAWEQRDLASVPAAELVRGCREIVAIAARHYLAVQSGILPAAYVAESLFAAVYNRLIKRSGDPSALTFLLGYDSAPIQAEESLYELAAWARAQTGLAAFLEDTASVQIVVALAGAAPAGIPSATWDEFSQRIAAYLGRFGYAIYDLDFAKPVPADDPAPLFETLKFFLTGRAADPLLRQAAAAARRETASRALLARLRGPRRRLFQRLLRPAQRFAPLREDALAAVGRGWPVLRRMLRELGRRLAAAGAIQQADDVFWLTHDELQSAAAALDAGEAVAAYPPVAERRVAWASQRRLTPPVYLPLGGGMRVFGLDWSRWLPARTQQAAGSKIRGIGTSPGRVTGTARVLHGPEEFNEMRPGEILVARITTPAWTPLFALAAGVVTDVGGPLSHGSIVAREYHIPAVLGTGVATERIHSGQRVTVDGEVGTVQVID
jgi:rifampicin phosphotransferase